MNAVARLLYKPFGVLVGVAGGLAAGAIFKRIWAAVTHQPSVPDATEAGRSWAEVLAAAATEGAIYALVKAATDRGGAIAFQRATGFWPGKVTAEA